MIIPPYIKPGDTIGVVSTARKVAKEELLFSIKTLQKWGLKVVLGKNLFNKHHQFAGKEEERLEDLQGMINNNHIKAILCARGGYGTVQIIDKIDFSNLKKHPKWIIGYSDITVLHSHLNKKGIASIHATMPINFLKNTDESLISLYNALFGKKNRYNITNTNYNKTGQVEAELVGGNLSILYSLLGSNSDLKTDNKILFLEDIDEYLYHVDRMVINLKRNNKLTKLKGLIVGKMKDMNDNIIPFGETAEEIILKYTKEYSFPICFHFPAGHLSDNRSLKFGVKTYLEINNKHVILQQ